MTTGLVNAIEKTQLLHNLILYVCFCRRLLTSNRQNLIFLQNFTKAYRRRNCFEINTCICNVNRLLQDGVYTLFLARPSLASMSVCSSIIRSTQNRGQTETPTTRYNGRTTAHRRWMFTITMQRCRYALPGPSTTTLH